MKQKVEDLDNKIKEDIRVIKIKMLDNNVVDKIKDLKVKISKEYGSQNTNVNINVQGF